MSWRAIPLAVLVLLFAHTLARAQRVLRVPSQYRTIQAAIDAARNGDVVLVAAGLYRENLDFKGKAVTVRSAAGAVRTVVDGSSKGSVVVFRSGEGPGSVLAGFTLRNGGGTLLTGGGTPAGGSTCPAPPP